MTANTTSLLHVLLQINAGKTKTHFPTVLFTLNIACQLQHLIFRTTFYNSPPNTSLARSCPVSLECLISGSLCFCESAWAGESHKEHPHLRSRLRGWPSAEVSQVEHEWDWLDGFVQSLMRRDEEPPSWCHRAAAVPEVVGPMLLRFLGELFKC